MHTNPHAYRHTNPHACMYTNPHAYMYTNPHAYMYTMCIQCQKCGMFVCFTTVSVSLHMSTYVRMYLQCHSCVADVTFQRFAVMPSLCQLWRSLMHSPSPLHKTPNHLLGIPTAFTDTIHLSQHSPSQTWHSLMKIELESCATRMLSGVALLRFFLKSCKKISLVQMAGD